MSFKKGRFIKILKDMDWVEFNYGISCKCKLMFIVFIVYGFVFKVNFIGKLFELVSLYLLMCKILGIFL